MVRLTTREEKIANEIADILRWLDISNEAIRLERSRAARRPLVLLFRLQSSLAAVEITRRGVCDLWREQLGHQIDVRAHELTARQSAQPQFKALIDVSYPSAIVVFSIDLARTINGPVPRLEYGSDHSYHDIPMLVERGDIALDSELKAAKEAATRLRYRLTAK